MGINFATWREIAEDSAGDVRDKVEAVMQLLPETDAGREFLERHASEDGQIPSSRRIFCSKVRELLKGLNEEGANELIKLIGIIRGNVGSIIQFNKRLKGGKKTFANYVGYYKQVKDAKFFPDKFFLQSGLVFALVMNNAERLLRMRLRTGLFWGSSVLRL